VWAWRSTGVLLFGLAYLSRTDCAGGAPMMIPVVPGHRRCQHCMDVLMLSVDGQLRTAQGERWVLHL